MPIVPRFSLRQDDDFLQIDVIVPYVKVSDMEFTVVDGTAFTFYCKPYLLKLSLPGAVVDDDRASASYDPDKDHGALCIRLPKLVPGETFHGLDLLTVLLQPQRRPTAGGAQRPHATPLIEELPDGVSGGSSEDAAATAVAPAAAGGGVGAAGASLSAADSSALDGDDVCASVPLPLASDLEGDVLSSDGATPVMYGFNGGKQRVFRTLEEFVCILETPDPDGIPPPQRRAQRLAAEDRAFDEQRFLGDQEDGEDVRRQGQRSWGEEGGTPMGTAGGLTPRGPCLCVPPGRAV